MWSSPPDALNNTYDTTINMNSRGLEAVWQLELNSYNPSEIQVHPDMLGSGGPRLGRPVQPLALQSDCVELNWDLLDEIPDVLPSNGDSSGQHINLKYTESQPEQNPPSSEHQVEAPVRRRGRRGFRCDTSQGWVPSKNLISEQKRRERLKKGLLSLRGLVPNITKMDRASILADTITHLQNLKRTVEILENFISVEGGGYRESDSEVAKTPCNDLGNRESEIECVNAINSSANRSCSITSFEPRCSPALDWSKPHIKCDVSKLEPGVFKFNFTCRLQLTSLIQLSRAIETFVIEIVYTSISAISPTDVYCTFVVKMSSGNEMTMGYVKSDLIHLLGQSGLACSAGCFEGSC